jgi:hypothetical protein
MESWSQQKQHFASHQLVIADYRQSTLLPHPSELLCGTIASFPNDEPRKRLWLRRNASRAPAEIGLLFAGPEQRWPAIGSTHDTS